MCQRGRLDIRPIPTPVILFGIQEWACGHESQVFRVDWTLNVPGESGQTIASVDSSSDVWPRHLSRSANNSRGGHALLDLFLRFVVINSLLLSMRIEGNQSRVKAFRVQPKKGGRRRALSHRKCAKQSDRRSETPLRNRPDRHHSARTSLLQ